MWQAFSWIAWIISAGIFVWLLWDFFRVNIGNSEKALLSSREGIDDLFSEQK